MARSPKPIPPSNTSHLFGGRKPGDRSAEMTRERIADDLEAFIGDGGKIEVLGVTRTLTRIGSTEGEAPAPAAPPPKSKSKR